MLAARSVGAWALGIVVAAVIAVAVVAINEWTTVHQVPAESLICGSGEMQTLLTECVQEHAI
jgi:hypothetical protein